MDEEEAKKRSSRSNRSRKHLRDEAKGKLSSSARVVIDCGYDSKMQAKEIVSLAKQIRGSYGRNVRSSQPLRMYLTSLSGGTKKELQKDSGFDRWLVGRGSQCECACCRSSSGVRVFYLSNRWTSERRTSFSRSKARRTSWCIWSVLWLSDLLLAGVRVLIRVVSDCGVFHGVRQSGSRCHLRHRRHCRSQPPQGHCPREGHAAGSDSCVFHLCLTPSLHPQAWRRLGSPSTST